MLPGFIFGGVKNTSHVEAAKYLLGSKRKRSILKLDIKRFFEQISKERVKQFFWYKCGCSEKAAELLAYFCCVPIGPKGSPQTHKTIARGFATSSRLAVWCNLDTFIKLDRLVRRRLRNKDPRIAIYVDDIGVTASRVTKEEMEELAIDIGHLLLNADRKQPLPLNENKTKTSSHEGGMEHLGLRLNRNSLSVGAKTKSNIDRIRDVSGNELSLADRVRVGRKRRAIMRYKKYVEQK
jgi:hypothetical protein